MHRLRAREHALSEQLAQSRAALWRVKEREQQVARLELEQKAQLLSAQRLEAAAKQQFSAREEELSTLRLRLQEAAEQLRQQAAMAKELQRTKGLLKSSELAAWSSIGNSLSLSHLPRTHLTPSLDQKCVFKSLTGSRYIYAHVVLIRRYDI